MQKFVVEQDFWKLFPEAQVNLIVLDGLDNTIKEQDISYFKKLLNTSTKAATAFLGEEVFSQNEVVAQWREAYRQFKTKKGARSSIEAMLKRVDQGQTFSPINPLVDIYNSISLTYGVPCGGEDLDKIKGDWRLGIAKGGEAFFPLGAETDAPALENEVIYYDDEGAICRCFNWREAQRTMLTEKTTHAVLVIESVNSEQAKRANEAMLEMKQLLKAHFNVTPCGEAVLTINHPELTR